jgi:hypothetical protein
MTFSSMSFGGGNTAVYSLQKDKVFTIERKTNSRSNVVPEIPYYVSTSFDRNYPANRSVSYRS